MQEFSFIERLLKPLAGSNSFGLTDDCAYFDGYAITKDVLVSGTHFFADDEPYDLARKALRVNLSDLAACGAKPFAFMLGLALPRNTKNEWLLEFTNGLKADIEEFGIQLLGGDTTSHHGNLQISITAIGKVDKPIHRSGAKEGDNIFVSGSIGGGFAGLQEYNGKYVLPQPRVELGQSLKDIATACIDISDGLLADLGHICTESNVGAEIFSKDIPLYSKKYTLHQQITGGDDYELCFTSAQDTVAGCYKIGRIISGEGLKIDGMEVKPQGYEHQFR